MDEGGYLIAALLILAGLAGAMVPAVPGIPLIFGGIWLAAWIDRYQHLAAASLAVIAVIGAVGLTVDLLAAALGAKRVGASGRAVSGALLGTVVGLFFGLPGLVLGPFVGAVLGELSVGKSPARAAGVGIGTWLGLLVGTVVKLVASIAMVAAAGGVWWWQRT